MSSPNRHVRRLRLRAHSEHAVHRAALLLEDALRTASLSDGGGRIVLVRKCVLGRIDGDASPQTLALVLERTMARKVSGCVYAVSSDAEHAPAVWFRDALDAHTQLALRLANGTPVDAWYWPLAVAAWRPESAVLLALRQIAFSLAALPEAPAALPRWAAALAGAGHIERLIAALRTDDVTPLALAAHVPEPRPGPTRSAGRSRPASLLPTEPVSDRPSSKATKSSPRTSSETMDPRRALLRALLRAAGAAAPNAVSDDHALQVSTRPRLTTQPDNAGIVRAASVHSNRRLERIAGTRRAEATLAPSLDAPLPRTDTAEPGEHVARARSMRGEQHLDHPPDSALRSEWLGVQTTAGGLLFLISVLQRLGYQGWLDVQPEWTRFDIARRVMTEVLNRLRVGSDDPAWTLTACRPATARTPRRFIAPARWHDGLYAGDASLRAAGSEEGRTLWDPSGRLLLGAWTGSCPRALKRESTSATVDLGLATGTDRVRLVTDAWLIATRRWLRRYAGLGLSQLVLRPGRLALTPTHVDLYFDLGQAELRLRRAGLDLDPGWTPWFHRVVRFHYEKPQV